MPRDANVVIVGAGCAGLSLAARLADAGPRAGRVVVLDERTTFGRDRTWCYWDVHEHPFAAAVTHRWSRWRVVAPDGAVVERGSTRYAYQHVPADAFYAEALARISRARHVELRLGERVDALADVGSAVHVYATGGALHAARVFDSRPSAAASAAPPASAAPRAARLVQAFAGAVVHTTHAAFDAGVATLMDFTVEQPGDGFAFGYVLPYTAHDALVEVAVVAERAPAPVALDAALARYADRLTGGAYGVRSREAGVIPMDAAPVVRRPAPRVTRIGVAGGMAKPSTGYAFLAIQRDAAALAHTLTTPGPAAVPRPRGAVARWLDHVFLRRLRSDPAAAPAMFVRLFAAADPDALVRFLSDVGSPSDAARVIAALPPLPFAAEACRLAAV